MPRQRRDNLGPIATLLAVAGMLVLPHPVRAQCSQTWSVSEFSQFSEAVRALVVHDDGTGPALYAGGLFADFGGVPLGHIARWNGAQWLPVGGGVQSSVSWPAPVTALTVFDPDGAGPLPAELVAAGSFNQAGGAPAARVARWNGATWAPVGPGLPGYLAFTLLAWDPDGPGPASSLLLVGGAGTPGKVVAWNGSAWAALGAGPGNYVYCLNTFDEDGAGPASPRLYAGGLAGVGSLPVARWDGAVWTPIGVPTSTIVTAPEVFCLTPFDPDGAGPARETLIIGGCYSLVGNTCGAISSWDGQALSPLGPCLGITSHDRVYASIVYDADGAGPQPGFLVADGEIRGTSTPPAPPLRRWDGTQWSSMGYVGSAFPTAMAVFDEDGAGPDPPSLFVGNDSGGGCCALVARFGCSPPCYANCDGSTAFPQLTVADFSCFLNAFAAGVSYANCDGSTLPPVLNITDFGCFLNAFAAGCG